MENINQKAKTILTVLVVAVILLWSVYLGFSSGQKVAYSRVIIKNFQATKSALDFFYLDQERFPSASEFSDKNVMQNYFSLMPFNESFFSICQNNFQYFRKEKKVYSLNVCLPTAILGFEKGLNIFENKK